MLPNEELHDEIMNAFNEYFKAHQRWVTIQNSQTCVDLRKELMLLKKIGIQLTNLCTDQRLVVQDWRYTHFSPKIPSKRAIAMIKERAQKEEDGILEPINKLKIRHKN
jgi:hypothetical protein